MEVSADVLQHRLSHLVLKAECNHTAGCFADVDDGCRPIPATGIFGAWLPKEINLFADLQVEVLRGGGSPRVVGSAEPGSGRTLDNGLYAHLAKALGMPKRCGFAIVAGRPDLIDAGKDLWDPSVNRIVRRTAVDGKQCVPTEHCFCEDAAKWQLHALLLELALDLVDRVAEECSSSFDESGMLVLPPHVQAYAFPCEVLVRVLGPRYA